MDKKTFEKGSEIQKKIKELKEILVKLTQKNWSSKFCFTNEYPNQYTLVPDDELLNDHIKALVKNHCESELEKLQKEFDNL